MIQLPNLNDPRPRGRVNPREWVGVCTMSEGGGGGGGN
jgi:hypothetical protein